MHSRHPLSQLRELQRKLRYANRCIATAVLLRKGWRNLSMPRLDLLSLLQHHWLMSSLHPAGLRWPTNTATRRLFVLIITICQQYFSAPCRISTFESYRPNHIDWHTLCETSWQLQLGIRMLLSLFVLTMHRAKVWWGLHWILSFLCNCGVPMRWHCREALLFKGVVRMDTSSSLFRSRFGPLLSFVVGILNFLFRSATELFHGWSWFSGFTA